MSYGSTTKANSEELVSGVSEILNMVCFIMAFVGLVGLIYDFAYWIDYKIVSKRLDSSIKSDKSLIIDSSNYRQNKKL